MVGARLLIARVLKGAHERTSMYEFFRAILRLACYHKPRFSFLKDVILKAPSEFDQVF